MLDPSTQEKLEELARRAIEFNKNHNIFQRKTKEEVFTKDIKECLEINSLINPKETILDVGSGGGFPGLVIGITNPNSTIDLVESNQKKCYFLNQIRHDLSLTNIRTLNQRIEPSNKLGEYSLITARAFATIDKILELTKNNLCKSGRYILFKGTADKIKEELTPLNTNKFNYEIINQDNKEKERHLVVIKNSE